MSSALVEMIGSAGLGVDVGTPDGFPDVTDIAGTEGTHEYTLVAYLKGVGRLGVRLFRPGRWRIRLEPTRIPEQHAVVVRALAQTLKGPDWVQPFERGQDRFSIVRYGQELRDEALRLALGAMLPLGSSTPLIQVDAPAWVRELVEELVRQDIATRGNERDRLIALVKQRRVPGSNSAKVWSLATLRRKVEESGGMPPPETSSAAAE